MNHEQAKSALRARIASSPSATRAETQRRMWVAAGAGSIAAVVAFCAFGGMHVGERSTLFVLVCALGLAALAVRASLLAVVALIAIAVNYALTGEAHTTPHNDLICALITALFALTLGGSFIVAFRATEPIRPERRGVQLAVTSTTLAAMFVFVICEHDNALHFALAHIGSVVVLGVLLAVVARRVVAVR